MSAAITEQTVFRISDAHPMLIDQRLRRHFAAGELSSLLDVGAALLIAFMARNAAEILRNSSEVGCRGAATVGKRLSVPVRNRAS